MLDLGKIFCCLNVLVFGWCGWRCWIVCWVSERGLRIGWLRIWFMLVFGFRLRFCFSGVKNWLLICGCVLSWYVWYGWCSVVGCWFWLLSWVFVWLLGLVGWLLQMVILCCCVMLMIFISFGSRCWLMVVWLCWMWVLCCMFDLVGVIVIWCWNVVVCSCRLYC